MSKFTKGFLLVLSSPSGGGKTTVVNKLLKIHPEFVLSVSATTRPSRKKEKHGVDYFFLSDSEFDRRIDYGDFVEWAWVYNYRYGTLKSIIEKGLSEDKVILLNTDIQGAESIKNAYPNSTVRVFILPPSEEELERRLRNRDSDSLESIETRLQNSLKEVQEALKFDYLVINHDLKKCVALVEKIILVELYRPYRVAPLEGWEFD